MIKYGNSDNGLMDYSIWKVPRAMHAKDLCLSRYIIASTKSYITIHTFPMTVKSRFSGRTNHPSLLYYSIYIDFMSTVYW